MLGSTHTLRRISIGLAVANCTAVVAVPSALAGGFDGRSPDTRDAAASAHASTYGAPDGWYPSAVSLTNAARTQVTDGRSPDTRDFAVQAHAPVVTVVQSPGFQWGDFGIGIYVEADTAVTGNVVESATRAGIMAGWGPYLRDVTITRAA